MSVKLFALVVTLLGLAALTATTVKAEPTSGAELTATEPSFEQLVEQRVAYTLQIVNVLVAKSNAPESVKSVVLSNAQQQITACAAQAVVDRLPGPFFACSGRVISEASDVLNAAASSGAGSLS
ncbi:uncharacterized protein LOC134209814 isoform X2 [Armigeres subalbatus]|uniref:uncharacterized protein LOC134209814 isoform X2 n=1 Tax=Armigeres subalbatus TaxID=124917 RepID=UPI002ED0485B